MWHSAVDVSLMAVQMPSNTMGRESVQLVGSGCTFREVMVDTFYQSICDEVVGSNADALGTKELHEVSEEFRLKLVSSDCGHG